MFSMMCVSWILILSLVVIIGLTFPDRWNGAYLLWGILVGVIGALAQLGMLWFIPRLLGDQKERIDRFRSRSVLRYRIFVPNVLILGVMSGALSAILNDRFLVLGYTVGVIVFCGAPYVILPIVARKLRKRST